METRICKHPECKMGGLPQPIANFGTKRGGGYQHLCKPCAVAVGKEYSKRGSTPPWSTTEGRSICEREGIRITTGNAVGFPGVDLAAWACVPIEAKSAIGTPAKDGVFEFSFGFSYVQAENGRAVIVLLIARYPDGHIRVFVVPVASGLFFRNGSHRFCVAIDSKRNKNWQRLRPYENAFHLIEHARQTYGAKLRAQNGAI